MRYLAVLLASGALGCLDFDLVAPDVVEPAVSISVLVTHDSATRYELDVGLRPGNDARGRSTGLSDTTVYVNDEPVQSLAIIGLGNRSLRWERTRPSSADADSLHLRLPVFAPGSKEVFEVNVPIPARKDPFDVTLNPGEDLRLHLTPFLSPVAFSPENAVSWQLVLRPTCEGGGGIQLTGDGPFPSELRVPWEWLQASTGPLMACFQGSSFSRNDGAPYQTTAFVGLKVHWRITIAGR